MRGLHTVDDLLTVVSLIEERRAKVVDASTRQIKLIPGETDKRMKMANPAERAWLKFIAQELTLPVTSIFDHQSHHGAPQQDWIVIMESQHPSSNVHLRRIRTTMFRTLLFEEAIATARASRAHHQPQ